LVQRKIRLVYLSQVDMWLRFAPEFQDLPMTSHVYDQWWNLKIVPILQFLLLGKGPFTTTGCDHGGYFNTTGTIKEAMPGTIKEATSTQQVR
jgi:hypothetical protein